MAKVQCKLKKTFGEAAKIDLAIRSLFRRRARIYKRIRHGGTITSHISGESVMRKSEFGTGGSRRLRRSGRGYTTSARRLGEPEPFSSFLPASPIDRNCRVQLVERRFGTASSPSMTYGEDLRRSEVHPWNSRGSEGPVPLVNDLRAACDCDDLNAERSRDPRSSGSAPLKSEVDFDRTLLISL